jgi:hypothetical protein
MLLPDSAWKMGLMRFQEDRDPSRISSSVDGHRQTRFPRLERAPHLPVKICSLVKRISWISK